jgi:hypothetical protein
MTRSLLSIASAFLLAAAFGCDGADNANPKAVPSAKGAPAGLQPAARNGADSTTPNSGQAAPPGAVNQSGALNTP